MLASRGVDFDYRGCIAPRRSRRGHDQGTGWGRPQSDEWGCAPTRRAPICPTPYRASTSRDRMLTLEALAARLRNRAGPRGGLFLDPGDTVRTLLIGLVVGCSSTTQSGTLGSDCPPSAPAPFSACSDHGATCTYDGCHSCVCMSDGTWACWGDQPGCSQCPAAPIHTGDSCTSQGAIGCHDWEYCGSFGCNCIHGAWQCVDSTCPARSTPGCPGQKPADGDPCQLMQASCIYPWAWTCSAAVCGCTGNGWSCAYQSDCADGG